MEPLPCKWVGASWSDYLLGAVVTLLLYVFLGCSQPSLPRFYIGAAHQLSRSSYTLYLVHLPMLVFIAACLESGFHQSRWIPDPRHVIYGIAIFALATLYAQAVWFVFERRTDDLRARLKFFFQSRQQPSIPSPDPAE